MEPKVLKLAPSGIPIGWTSLKDAAIKMCSETSDGGVLWALGEDAFSLRGGFNSMTGKRSDLKIPAIMAVNNAGDSGKSNLFEGFSREICKYREELNCAYCGNYIGVSQLTMDHIFPESRGGLWTMDNIISACVKCNNNKGNKTPEEAGMPLLVKPFIPTMAEVMFLRRQGRMLGIQYEYLREQFQHIEMRESFKSFTDIAV